MTDIELVREIIWEIAQELKLDVSLKTDHFPDQRFTLYLKGTTYPYIVVERYLLKGTKLFDSSGYGTNLADPNSMGILKADMGLSYFVAKEDNDFFGIVKIPWELTKCCWRARKALIVGFKQLQWRRAAKRLNEQVRIKIDRQIVDRFCVYLGRVEAWMTNDEFELPFN